MSGAMRYMEQTNGPLQMEKEKGERMDKLLQMEKETGERMDELL